MMLCYVIFYIILFFFKIILYSIIFLNVILYYLWNPFNRSHIYICMYVCNVCNVLMYVCMYVFGNITYHTYAHTYRPTDSYPFSDWLQRSNPFLMLQVPQDLWGLYPAGRPCWPWQLLILGWFGV